MQAFSLLFSVIWQGYRVISVDNRRLFSLWFTVAHRIQNKINLGFLLWSETKYIKEICPFYYHLKLLLPKKVI